MHDIHIVYVEGICKRYSFLICSIPYHPSPCETEKVVRWVDNFGIVEKVTLCQPCKDEETCDGTIQTSTETEISTSERDNYLWLIGTVVLSILLVILIVLVSVCICSKKKTIFVGIPLKKSINSDEKQADFDNIYAKR